MILTAPILIAGAAAAGACVASFVMLAWSRRHWRYGWWQRLNQSSRCFSCKRVVRGLDNIPIVSWLVLRGRCRDCGSRIPVSYWVVELVGAGVAGLAAWVWV